MCDTDDAIVASGEKSLETKPAAPVMSVCSLSMADLWDWSSAMILE